MKDYIDNKFMDLFNTKYLPNCRDVANKSHPDCCNDLRRTPSDEEEKYDTSQYDDDLTAYKVGAVSPKLASSLLSKQDGSLPSELAWSLLRNMTTHEDYRDKILEEYRKTI